MVRISRSGIESIRFAPEKQHQQCIFEHVYFSRPDSVVFGRPVNQSREELGRLLAREHPVEADIVTPVPDSGVPAAVGYAAESGIPFRMGLIRNHYVGRTFIEPEQAIRDFGVKLKLNPDTAHARRAARGSGGRFDRARHHQPQNRSPGARSRRDRSSRAHQLPADDFALLLRRRYAAPRGTDRRAAIPSKQIRKFLGADSLGYLSLESLRAAVEDTRRKILHGVLHRQLSDRAGATGSGGSS